MCARLALPQFCHCEPGLAGAAIEPEQFVMDGHVASLLAMTRPCSLPSPSKSRCFVGPLAMTAGLFIAYYASIGLVRRWRWAWVWVLLVLAGFVGRSVNETVEGPTPEQNYTSADGVRHTVSATEVNYPFHVFVIAVAVGLFVFLRQGSYTSLTQFRFADQANPHGFARCLSVFVISG